MKYIILFITLALLPSAIARDPNFIIIFTDDQGYNDLGCYGSPHIKTPHLDQLAAEGTRLTDFHVPSPVCSPSRAGLLTGCYPKRVGMHKHVIFPSHTHGLHPDELTIADHLRDQGYATACIGKWHLGHIPETLPTANGFDQYFGIPYSNDMSHPDNRGEFKGSQDQNWTDQKKHFKAWNTPLMRDTQIIELPVDQRTVTRRYTDEAIRFVETNKDKPFFLYLPHSMPHIPLFVPDNVYDSNPKNAYTCVIEHIDTECGRLIQTIRDLKLDKNTYIIFTSDNGPWLQFNHHAGNADPLRDGKGTTFEGGQRVPCIVWGPGRIPAGAQSNALTSTIDLLPTIATLSGHPLTPTQKIDGLDITKSLTSNAKSPRTEFIHYSSVGTLEGIRQGDWKLLVKRQKKGRKKKANKKVQTMLFNLSDDIGEQTNLAEKHPEKVKALTALMTKRDAEITANARPVFKQSSKPQQPQAKETYDILSTHQTDAVYKGRVEQPCRHRTAECPDRCNHGGTVAQFTISNYISYNKPGKYGDAKTKEFAIMLKSPDMDQAMIDQINLLKPRTPLKLSWEHRYITKIFPNGTSSKFPRRVITLLKKTP